MEEKGEVTLGRMELVHGPDWRYKFVDWFSGVSAGGQRTNEEKVLAREGGESHFRDVSERSPRMHKADRDG